MRQRTHKLIPSKFTIAIQHISKQGKFLALRSQLICFVLVYKTTKRLTKFATGKQADGQK